MRKLILVVMVGLTGCDNTPTAPTHDAIPSCSAAFEGGCPSTSTDIGAPVCRSGVMSVRKETNGMWTVIYGQFISTIYIDKNGYIRHVSSCVVQQMGFAAHMANSEQDAINLFNFFNSKIK
jgi:hypothetical protein